MAGKLEAVRFKIDSLDRRIAALLARRFALAAPLLKLRGKPADPARERRVLANAAAAGGRIYAPATRAVFKEIIRQTKRLQAGRC